MSWDEEKHEVVAEDVQEAAPEVKEIEKEVVEEKAKEEPKTVENTEEDEAEAPSDDQKKEQDRRIGKAFKTLREKKKASDSEKDEYKEQLQITQQKLLELEAKLSKQATQDQDVSDSYEQDDDSAEVSAEVAAEQEFLRRETLRAFDRYGEENVKNALEIVKNQNNPTLEKKIRSSHSPGEALMLEATRIIEQESLGSTPEEREANIRKKLEEELREKITQEVMSNLQRKQNQPPDMSSLRVAGGDHKVRPSLKTWAD